MPPRLLRLARAFALIAAFITAAVTPRAEEEKKPETNVTVQVAKVTRTTLRAYVTGYGLVESAPHGGPGQPAGGARLAASASGLVAAVSAIEGARVEKNSVLVQLDARAADAAVARAQSAVSTAEKAHARQTQLSAIAGTSERALLDAAERRAAARGELAAAQFQQSQLAIRAPVAGTLIRLTVKPGEWLDAGKEVAEVVDADRLVVALQVPATEAVALRAGQPASVFTRLGLAEQPLAQATVLFVSPQISAGTDSVVVRLALPKDSGARPGQFLAARIVTEERADRLAVPRESVYTDGDGASTLSIVEKDIARQKTVTVGLRDGNLVEVSGEGVTEGATVVTLGSYALPKETKVRVLAPAKEGAK